MRKKFAKATKAKLAEAHDHLNKAADCMKASGYDADEDDAKKAEDADDLQKASLSEALQKAEGLTAEVERLKGENDTLQKSSSELQSSVEELLLKLQVKGAVRAVAKTEDALTKVETDPDPTPEEAEALAKRAADPKETIKEIFRKGGTPIFSTPR